MQATQQPVCGTRSVPRKPGKRRIPAFWVRQFHTWHWMSSAICLVGMILFAVTGITLNHAGSIE
ncbi:MAG: PepSY-associated TM helix domain-containing protein, partial [Alphaproteobacteria bacterium]|nr:PepSY-associated TM helix domain-containing protein [Alphaproteobacteria bacterium]